MNFREIQHITAWRHQVTMIVEDSLLFPVVQKLWNWPRNTRVIAKNKLAHFSSHSVHTEDITTKKNTYKQQWVLPTSEPASIGWKQPISWSSCRRLPPLPTTVTWVLLAPPPTVLRVDRAAAPLTSWALRSRHLMTKSNGLSQFILSLIILTNGIKCHSSHVTRKSSTLCANTETK